MGRVHTLPVLWTPSTQGLKFHYLKTRCRQWKKHFIIFFFDLHIKLRKCKLNSNGEAVYNLSGTYNETTTTSMLH